MPESLEYYKQEQDFLKHLTTLSTGSILLLVTFLEKLFAKPLWTHLIWISLLGFICSIIATLTVHLFSVLDIDEEDSNTFGNKYPVLGLVLVLLSFGGFLTGLLSLVIFAIKNLP